MKYRPEIDGLRAVAVLPVILFHAGFSFFVNGFVGVDVFFVISGYLITTIILNEVEEKRFTLANFYERRVRRIMPAMLATILLCIPLSYLLHSPYELEKMSVSIISTLTFWSNIFFWRHINYFDDTAEFKPLLHTWSLSIEEQFYFLFPLFTLLFFIRFRTLYIRLLIAFFVASIILYFWGAREHPNAAFYLLPTRAWQLLLGILCAYYLKYVESRKELNLKMTGIGLGLIVLGMWPLDIYLFYPGFNNLFATIGTAFIIISPQHGGFIKQRILSNIHIVRIGLISYSLYLFHQPIYAFLKYAYGHLTYQHHIFALVAVFVLSVLSYKFVEAPFRSFSRVKTRPLLITVGLISAMALLFAVYGIKSGGIPSRYDESYQGLFKDLDEAANYIPAKFDALRGKGAFEAGTEKKKVILIGDSYAMDLVNAVSSTSMIDDIDLRVRHISMRCGNLYLPVETFEKDIESGDLVNCHAEGWYDEKLRKLIKEADELWLASRWKDWHLKYLADSINALKTDFDKPIVLFGTKQFWTGPKNFSALMKKFDARTIETPPSITEQNEKMRQIAASQNIRFFNPMQALCGPSATCDLSDGQDSIISVDSGHLTDGGVAILGHHLEEFLK